MSYGGHVENGVVVLDDPLSAPNGTRAIVDLVGAMDSHSDRIPNGTDPFWGLYAADEDLIDQITQDVLSERAERWFRNTDD